MNIQKLIEILMELRRSSFELRKNPTEVSLKALMKKYNMLFLGEDFNTIYSNELAHSINTVFNIPVSNDEINKLIPIACKMLNMDCESMVNVSDVSMANPPVACYQITL